MLEEKSSKVNGLRQKFFGIYIIATIACILAATIVSIAFVSVSKAKTGSAEDTPPNDTENPTTQLPSTEDHNPTPGTTAPGNTDIIPSGSVQWIPAPGIASGSLVLVNKEYTYISENAGIFTSNDPTRVNSLQVLSVRDNRTSDTKNLQSSTNTIELSYAFTDALCKMADAMVENCGNTTRDLMVNTGYLRDIDPSSSEYHTGLSAELRMIDLNETPTRYYQLKDPDAVSSSISLWLSENCHNYGIILRYPASKVAQTGVSASQSQYRFVGVVHAKYMKSQNYSLEEYVQALKAYNYNKRLDITVDEQSYSLYYVKETDAKDKGIPVPKNVDYEISGNNMDGYFIN